MCFLQRAADLHHRDVLEVVPVERGAEYVRERLDVVRLGLLRVVEELCHPSGGWEVVQDGLVHWSVHGIAKRPQVMGHEARDARMQGGDEFFAFGEHVARVDACEAQSQGSLIPGACICCYIKDGGCQAVRKLSSTPAPHLLYVLEVEHKVGHVEVMEFLKQNGV